MNRLTKRILTMMLLVCIMALAPGMAARGAQKCDCTVCNGTCECGCCDNTEIKPWDGKSADTSWYDAAKTSFVITKADQLAGLSKLSYAGVDFAGKTVKLGADIDLGGVCFNPIDLFKGTFDGDGHTIHNMTIETQNVPTLSKRYIALFREIDGGTVKNLTMNNAQLVPYWETVNQYTCEQATVASMTNGTTLFENIKIMNSRAETYNNTVAGVVGEAYGDITFRNVQVDASNYLSALWETYDARVGGILGYTGSNVDVVFENCISSPVLNVYNDAMANYQYFLYRYSGMLIGEITDPATTTVTSRNTKVAFGEWNQYTYCEFDELGKGSYNGPNDWKYCRTDNERCAPGHTHDEYESCTVLLPFTNLTGRRTGGKPDYELPGVTIENIPYYFVIVENGEGSGIYKRGSKVTIKADTFTCCDFKVWDLIDGSSDAVKDEAAATTTITVPAEVMHVKAIYTEKKPEENPVGDEEQTMIDGLPKTGDDSMLWLWVAALAAVGAAGMTLRIRRREN